MFYSVLFPKYEQYQNTKDEPVLAKPYFKDLGLDLIFESIIKSNQKVELEKYYYNSLQDIETISYRQEVMRELESIELRSSVTEFSNEVYLIRHGMDEVRKKLSTGDKQSKDYLIRGHMLDYAERYCLAITNLKEKFSKGEVSSDGLSGFARYISEYVETERYQDFTLAVKDLREEFSSIEYSMLINSGTIKVRKYEGEKDYSKKILAAFEKFRQGDVKDYRHKISEEPVANHVESAVLNLLSKLYKETFDHLLNFCSDFIQFDDETIIQFSEEIQFYIAWLDYIQPLKDDGLAFNYPKMEFTPEHLYGDDCFDLPLAKKVKNETVKNDFTIKSPESILVVTGPNQGGKTTFAKMFGQMHYLASIGLCVPGKSSSLYIFDNIFTHFGKEEDLSTGSGKLKDDLERLFEITSQATGKSLIIINEIFSSTTVKDAVTLGNHMMDKLIDLKAPTVVVTFLDELSLRNEAVVSMMSTVKEKDPTERTYKIVRKPADGSAYAIHIARKHDLTYDKLSRRLNQ